MKVLVVSQTTFSNMAGLYEHNLCQKLESRGVYVTSFTLSGDNSKYCKHSLRAINSSNSSSITKGCKQLYSSMAHKAILNSSFDLIHLNSPLWSFLPLQLTLLNKFLAAKKTKIVVTTHSFYPLYQKRLNYLIPHSIKTLNARELIYGIRCLAFNYADRVICMTNLEKKFFVEELGLDESKVTVIPNAVDLSRLNVSTYDFFQRFKIQADFVLLYVGQVVPIKGIFYLLDALRIIRSKGYNCKLVIVTYNLREDISSHVAKLGLYDAVVVIDYNKHNLKDADLISAYKACDLFVLPSLTECFPTVLLEAMACEKPVVATRVGGVPEVVIDNFNGYLCEPGNSQDLANKILLVIDSPDVIEKMGRNGFSLIQKKYNWDNTISSIVNLYKAT